MPSLPSLRALTPSAGSSPKLCDLCDATDFEPIAAIDRRGQPLQTYVCRRCGLVCHKDVPTDHQLDSYYANEYRHDYHGEVTPSARRVLRAWRNGQRIARQLRPWLEPSASVFEVGAGIGCTVKALDFAGCRASGIDPGIGFAEYAREVLRANVSVSRLFDLAPEPKHDLVLLVHVIEHFNSPRRALDHIWRLLRPGGRLYVECPNLAAPFARRSRLFHFAHIHNFTPQTLAMLAGRSGFHVERTYSTVDDPNLQMLLTKVDVPRLVIDPTSYPATLAALSRYNNWTYHVRWNYLAPRLRKLAGYVWERIAAKREVSKLIARCQGSGEACPAKRRAA
jgi:2-polyprenyl-3-methyl-5-hydroxy-6-metoxy-1,4-benzoquinol methylase